MPLNQEAQRDDRVKRARRAEVNRVTGPSAIAPLATTNAAREKVSRQNAGDEERAEEAARERERVDERIGEQPANKQRGAKNRSQKLSFF